MMQTVTLTEREWQTIMGVLAQAPWNVANPLLMKLGEQLRPKPPMMSTDGLDEHLFESPPGPGHVEKKHS